MTRGGVIARPYMRQQARREVIVGAILIHGRVFSIDVKKRFYFPYVFKIKPLKICFLCKLIVRFLCYISPNDRVNCSGLLLLSTIFVACWADYMRVGKLSLRQKITVNVFYSTFTNGFYFCHVFYVFYFGGERSFHLWFFSAVLLVKCQFDVEMRTCRNHRAWLYVPTPRHRVVQQQVQEVRERLTISM